jgi:DNA (cytosine-5)-methyltransferase 1
MKLAKSKQSGSLHQYVKKVRGENGDICEYPKIIGERDPDNITHWNYQLTWKEKVDGRWYPKCRSVPRSKVRAIEQILREGQGVLVAIDLLETGDRVS